MQRLITDIPKNPNLAPPRAEGGRSNTLEDSAQVVAAPTPTQNGATPSAEGPQKARPVVLLHGFASTPRVMGPVARHLRRALSCETVCIPVSSTDDLRAQAQGLLRSIRKLARQHGGPIDIVAHSMGGLIATYALKVLDRGRHIASVVTLGTPHGGSPLARLGGLLRHEAALVLKQMLPGSDFLKELEKLSVPAGCRLVSVAGTRDLIVPVDFSRIKPSRRQRTLWVDGATHSSLLLSRATFQTVGAVLSRALEGSATALAA